MPKPLDIDRLKQFKSRPSTQDTDQLPVGSGGGFTERWPSREPLRDGQISIKATIDVIERFKRLCKDDRRTYADMLGILMNLYEAKR